jgi:hypothetical protein
LPKGERPNELGFGVFALKLPVSDKESNGDADTSGGQRPDRNVSDRDSDHLWLMRGIGQTQDAEA